MVNHLYLNSISRQQNLRYNHAYIVMQIGDALFLVFIFRTIYLFLQHQEQNDRLSLLVKKIFYLIGVALASAFGYLSYNIAFEEPELIDNPDRQTIAVYYAIGTGAALLNTLPAFSMHFGRCLMKFQRLTSFDEDPIDAPRLAV